MILDDNHKSKEELISEIKRLRYQNNYLPALYDVCRNLLKNPLLFFLWDDSLIQLIQYICTVLDTPHSFVSLAPFDIDMTEVDEKEIVIEFKAGTGIFSKEIKEFNTLTKHIQKIRHLVIISDESEVTLQQITPSISDNVQNVITTPIFSYKQSVIGIFGVAYGTDSDQKLTDEKLLFLNECAELISFAAHESYLFQDVLSRLEECKQGK